jgi:hypothetical protein
MDDKQLDSLSLHALPPVYLPISEHETLIEIATSGYVKIEFKSEATARILDWAALRVSCLGESCCLDTDALCNHVPMRVDSRLSLA